MISEILTTALVTANMLGHAHVLQRAKAQGAVVQFAEVEKTVFRGGHAVQPTEAIQYLQRRVPIPSKTIVAIVADARKRADAAATRLVVQLHEQLDTQIADALRNGDTLQQFTRSFNGMLERAGLSPAAPFRIETIFRTNTTAAYNAGRVAMAKHPDVAGVFGYLQYNAVMDGATRPEHAEMNGRVYPIDSPVWDTWMPPNGYN